MTSEVVKPNQAKVDIILNLRLPKSVKQIKSFLSVTGYYRKFMRDYSKVAYPMIRYLKKDVKLDINDPNYIHSFEKLKKILTESPVLKYPNFEKRFQLVTDASGEALGAVLQQDGHPICFASRTLNDHERNYSATERELLAIVWSTNYFRPYLYGTKFEILSDHQPLRWLFAKSQGKMSPRLHRWLIKLSEFNVTINYIKGKENQVADILGRINAKTNEINMITDSVNSLYNNDSGDIETIHSQMEDLHNHIPILDTVVNRFKIQIILTDKKQKDIDVKHKNKKIYISSTDLQSKDSLENILRQHLVKGKVG